MVTGTSIRATGLANVFHPVGLKAMDIVEQLTIHTDTVLAGRYRIEKLLGSGSMGEVYQAIDLTTTRLVAIKRIHPYLITDEDAIQRFQREAKALSRLNHPGIVKFHDFYVADGFYFIVLNHLEGQTLEDRLAFTRQKERLIPLEETRTIFLQLCDALAYAHQQNIVHRDLKPANVMITPQGHAIVMDFGIAKLLDGDQLTGDGLSPGTPGYMSPEIIRGRTIDGRSDIYTLGIILYEMVTGQRPFRGNSRYDTMHSHLFESIPDVYQFNPLVPPGLIHIIYTALAKEPADRFQSVTEMGQALRELDLTPQPQNRRQEPIIPPPPTATLLDTSPTLDKPASEPEPIVISPRVAASPTRPWRPSRLLIALIILPLCLLTILAVARGFNEATNPTPTISLTGESVEATPQSLPQTILDTTISAGQTVSPDTDATPGATPTLAPTVTPTASRSSGGSTITTSTPSAPTATPRNGVTPTNTRSQTPAATTTPSRTNTPPPTATIPPTVTPHPTLTPAPLPTVTNTPRPEVDPKPSPTPKDDKKLG